MSEHKEMVLTDSWDWQTRVLHWINALLVITLILLILGKEGMEMLGVERALRAPLKRYHAYAGYIFVCTFFLRVIWAFAGNRYARWADIIPFRAEQRSAIVRNIRWYLSGFKGSPARAEGHDALASLFYIALFAVLLSQAVTGLILSGAEFKMYPAYAFMGGMDKEGLKAVEEALGEVHEFGMWFMFFFLAAHLAGLVVHEVKEKNGLLSSMVHGKKYFPKED